MREPEATTVFGVGECGAPVDYLWKPGVWLDGDGKGCHGGKAPDIRQHQVWSEAAVEAERVHAKSLENRRDAFDVGARKELAVFAERDCRYDRERRVLLRREDCRLGFVSVAHRFDHDEICSRLGPGGDLLREGVVGRVKFEIARGLEESTRRPDVERNEALPPDGGRGFSRNPDSCRDYVRERRVAVVLRGICAEGVGVHRVSASGEVCLVYGANVAWTREVPEFGDFAGLEALCLQLRAHSAVQEKDAAGLCYEVGHSDDMPFLTPMTALTDFDGTIRSESVSDTPARRGASRRARSVRCAERGKSP